MLDLKTVVFMLLNGEEVVITDQNNHYEVKLEKVPDAVDFHGETTLLIRSERLKEATNG